MFRTAAAVLALVAGFALVSCSAADAQADKKVGHFNKVLKPDDAAPDFKDLEGVDGKKHALADYKDKDVVVLVITCNECPVAQAYQDRIIDFTKEFAGPGSKVAVVAINVNNDGEDKLDEMIKRAREKEYNFPYLYDPSQKIGRELGASVTPEFFVLNKDRKVVYMGAMDNSIKAPTVNYLEPAVKAALKGETPEVQETRGHGCGVPYEKQK
jgi:peroxiredoxin